MQRNLHNKLSSTMYPSPGLIAEKNLCTNNSCQQCFSYHRDWLQRKSQQQNSWSAMYQQLGISEKATAEKTSTTTTKLWQQGMYRNSRHTRIPEGREIQRVTSFLHWDREDCLWRQALHAVAWLCSRATLMAVYQAERCTSSLPPVSDPTRRLFLLHNNGFPTSKTPMDHSFI